MRALAVVLLLFVPLSANDTSPLEKAVELFKSPDAGKREAGSQLAARELRKLLAPLLEAMEDDDPEVRRRARPSVFPVVREAQEREVQEDQKAANSRTAAAAPRANQSEQIRGAFAIARFVQDAQARKASRLLVAFGVPTRCALNKPGFFVQEVREGSPAERLGLRRGDVIVQVNRRGVTRSRDFLAALGDKPDWSRITVKVLRDGRLVCLPKE
jgi:hypothetical protein